jgi:oligopeptide transport system ATP-binding protein
LDEIYVKADNIRMYFPIKGGILQRKIADIKAVDGISLAISKGEVLGLAGETGCGKTTLAKCLLRLLRPTAGNVYIDGVDINSLRDSKMRAMRQHIQMIFENPALSLDPGMRVWELIGEPLRVHKISSGRDLRARVDELLRLVELEPYHAERYPNELSGGEKQRVEIARALSTAPAFIIFDNALSQLDTSIQGQMLALFHRLRKEHDLTYLFIAHDLAQVRQISDRITIMYSGKLMESASCNELKPDPKAERERKILLLPGELPSPISPPSGCRFHTRCREARNTCSYEEPYLRDTGEGHFVACHFAEGMVTPI